VPAPREQACTPGLSQFFAIEPVSPRAIPFPATKLVSPITRSGQQNPPDRVQSCATARKRAGSARKRVGSARKREGSARKRAGSARKRETFVLKAFFVSFSDAWYIGI